MSGWTLRLAASPVSIRSPGWYSGWYSGASRGARLEVQWNGREPTDADIRLIAEDLATRIVMGQGRDPWETLAYAVAADPIAALVIEYARVHLAMAPVWRTSHAVSDGTMR